MSSSAPPLGRHLILVSVMFSLLACRTYVPLQNPTALEGKRIRATLTDRGVADLAPAVGPGVESLDGRVIESDSAAIVLSVSALQYRSGIDNIWNGEPVMVARSSIETLREERISRTRTALTVLGFFVGSFVLNELMGNPLGGDESKPQQPPPGGQ